MVITRVLFTDVNHGGAYHESCRVYICSHPRFTDPTQMNKSSRLICGPWVPHCLCICQVLADVWITLRWWNKWTPELSRNVAVVRQLLGFRMD